MGIMVYSLLWVMQDFVHPPFGPLGLLFIFLVRRLQNSHYNPLLKATLPTNPLSKHSGHEAKTLNHKTLILEASWSLF